MREFVRERRISYKRHSAAVCRFYFVLTYGVEENETLIGVKIGVIANGRLS